jgi:epoxyqueuosine reductase
VLDATRCISYLTIELREAIPDPLRTGMGDWVFGCDICQDVCPWNRRTPQSTADQIPFEPLPDINPIALLPLFDLSDDQFRERFRRTPLWRAKRRGILRNAAMVLGNQRCHAALPQLRRAAENEEAMISEACRWAIQQIEKEAY